MNHKNTMPILNLKGIEMSSSNSMQYYKDKNTSRDKCCALTHTEFDPQEIKNSP